MSSSFRWFFSFCWSLFFLALVSRNRGTGIIYLYAGRRAKRPWRKTLTRDFTIQLVASPLSGITHILPHIFIEYSSHLPSAHTDIENSLTQTKLVVFLSLSLPLERLVSGGSKTDSSTTLCRIPSGPRILSLPAFSRLHLLSAEPVLT